MIGFLGVIAMFTVLALSLVVTRLATVALMLTGLSEEAARFQARSAFTGTGFTTKEAESVVDHPVRRQVIMWLMAFRSAGVITIIMSLILSFIGEDSGDDKLHRLAAIAVGAMLFFLLAQSRWLERVMKVFISRALRRWTELDTRDYANLLNLADQYAVNEVYIKEGDWLAKKQLKSSRLREEGVMVLGIQHSDGTFIGAPTGDTRIEPNDTLILYGRHEAITELDNRPADYFGQKAHEEAVRKQEAEEAKQKQQAEAEESEDSNEAAGVGDSEGKRDSKTKIPQADTPKGSAATS